MTIREIKAKSILRKYKKKRKRFSDRYIRAYRLSIETGGEEVAFLFCGLFNLAIERALIGYERRAAENKRCWQDNRSRYT